MSLTDRGWVAPRFETGIRQSLIAPRSGVRSKSLFRNLAVKALQSDNAPLGAEPYSVSRGIGGHGHEDKIQSQSKTQSCQNNPTIARPRNCEDCGHKQPFLS